MPIDQQPPSDDVDADVESVARTIALRKLTAKACTRHELDRALQAKNVPEGVIDGVLDRLQEVGLVNDASFAVDWVTSRQQRRHLSRRLLRRELQAKGVERSHIDSALDRVDRDAELNVCSGPGRAQAGSDEWTSARGPVSAAGRNAEPARIR